MKKVHTLIQGIFATGNERIFRFQRQKMDIFFQSFSNITGSFSAHLSVFKMVVNVVYNTRIHAIKILTCKNWTSKWYIRSCFELSSIPSIKHIAFAWRLKHSMNIMNSSMVFDTRSTVFTIRFFEHIRKTITNCYSFLQATF